MEEKKAQEKKYPCKRRTKADGKRLNMYVVIDFNKNRGIKKEMIPAVNGDGKLCTS